jgi:hypothetical protein
MPMDSQFDRENDSSNTSNPRSIAPPPLSPKGLGTESSSSAPKLGRLMPSNAKKSRGSIVVGRILKHQQRITNSKGRFQGAASCGYIRRCVRQWLWDKQHNNRNARILDTRRKINFNKRRRTTDDMDSPATIRRKIPKQTCKGIFGQHNSDQVRDESRRYSISNSSGPYVKNSSNTKEISDTFTMCSYPRNQQY